MPRTFDFDRDLQDFHELTPAQRDVIVRQVTREAKAARAQAMREVFQAVGRRIRALAWASAAPWNRYQRRRGERIAAAQLYEMDDYMLKDIGIRRGEIEFAVSGREDPTRLPRSGKRKRDPLAALRLQPGPQDRPQVGRPAQAGLPLVLRNSCAG
jgi:uncharacterized protein YjiS (DUF1127 family)